MCARLQTQAKVAPEPSLTPIRTGLLQRKCACGGTPGPTGECAECRKNRLTLHRHAANQVGLSTVPPIVHDVLSPPGQPLDAATRDFVEPRFGHDFGRVRVHTDARADSAAQVVNAHAYAVGRDIVVGAGRIGSPEALLAGQAGGAPTLQAKLEINQPGDVYEQEADRAAEAVMRDPAPLVQRQIGQGEKEYIRANPLIGRIFPAIRRVQGEEERPQKPVGARFLRSIEEKKEEDMPQTKSMAGQSSASALPQREPSDANDGSIPSERADRAESDFQMQLDAGQDGGQPLAPPVRLFMETRFGVDFDQVRVHTDAQAASSALSLNALAYTKGRNVVFAPGKYDPHSYAGRKLLAHELVHVIQQQGASPANQIQRQTSYGTLGPHPRAIREPEDPRTVFIPPAGETPEIQRQEAPTTTGLDLEPPGAQQTTDGGAGPPGPMQTAPPAAPAATPTLNLTAGTRLTRGDTLTAAVNFTPSAGETLNVTAWRYVTPAHGTVTRPTSDSGFQRQWSGVMAHSGTLEIAYTVTPAGGTVGAAATLRQDVAVGDRTGAPWASSPTLEGEDTLGGQPSPPQQFRQLGRHNGNITRPIPTTTTVASGPNAQFTFVSALTTGNYMSEPRIHPDLIDTGSRFYKFHLDPSRLYLLVGTTRTLIPLAEYSNLSVSGGTLTFDVPDWEAFYKKHNYYSVTANDGVGGPDVPLRNSWWGLDSNASNANLASRDDPAIRRALRIPSSQGFAMNGSARGSWEGFQLMQAPAILTGTRSHEYQHARHSHRANFLAMVRALDPQRKIESTVSTPTLTVNLDNKIGTWVSEILKPDHELVDETQSRVQEKFVALSGVTMAGINSDPVTGAFLGTVWNISADQQMT